MARRAFAVTVVLSMLALCPPSFAANQTVDATVMNAFVQSSVTINQGETVTWTNVGGGQHNVAFDDNSFVQPAMPATDNWSVQRTFDQPGTYPYYCQVHGGPMGFGMSGVVIVKGASSGGGGPGGSAQRPLDAAPVSSLVAASSQRLDKLSVLASMNKTGTLTAAGTVTVPGGAAKLYRFKSVTRPAAANVPVKLPLKLAKRASAAVRKALRHGKKLKAKVTLTARDATGHQTILKRTIRLRR